MVPNATLPKEPFGSFSGGVLLTLKASARNSKFILSVTRKVLPSMTSAFWRPGPRTGLRELLPMKNGPAAANAVLSNQAPALRAAKSFGFAMRLGRCTA